MMRISLSNRRVAADALELLFLQQPQQLCLRARRHVAHFIHEDGSAVGLLEFADAPPVGAGECPALVAEEFAFQKRFRDGRAVDCQKRGLAAAAVLIDRPGDQFLAGPALAKDQHGHVLRGNAANGFIEVLHGRRRAHQLIVFCRDRLLLVIHRRHAADPTEMDGTANNAAKLVEVQGLEQVLERAKLHRLDGGVRASVGGDDDYGKPRVDLPDQRIGVQARHVGQSHVQNHGVRRVLPNTLDSLAGGADGENLETRRFQGPLQRIANIWLVVDDQHIRHGIVALWFSAILD